MSSNRKGRGRRQNRNDHLEVTACNAGQFRAALIGVFIDIGVPDVSSDVDSIERSPAWHLADTGRFLARHGWRHSGLVEKYRTDLADDSVCENVINPQGPWTSTESNDGFVITFFEGQRK
jgi:hypothetical protein